MKLSVPMYFSKFHCIANKCKDNCCKTGWEIDIDTKSANLYANISGEFGEKLRKNINFNKPAHFTLNSHNNCPFLNNTNLCEIILNLGENSLCQICTEHPRFYEWFKGIKEGGIGLCCEEAARIILSENNSFSTYSIEIEDKSCEDYDCNLYNYLYGVREKIISYIEDNSIPFNKRIRNILWYSYTIQQNINSGLLDEEDFIEADNISISDFNPILNFYLQLDFFNINFNNDLKKCINLNNDSINLKINNFIENSVELKQYMKNLAIYFVWRYFLKSVFDEDIFSKIVLMAVSIGIIEFLIYCKYFENDKIDIDDCIEIVKNYSQEIEYSEDNLFQIENATYENIFFNIEYLMGLF